VADDAMTGDQPTYRDLWLRIREELPKQGRKTAEVGGEPKPPLALQAARWTHFFAQGGAKRII
jgi:type III restriction enzyme